jgi:hypothetical protein
VVHDMVREDRSRTARWELAQRLHARATAAQPPAPAATPPTLEEPGEVLSKVERVQREADARVRESQELLQTLRDVVAYLQTAPPGGSGQGAGPSASGDGGPPGPQLDSARGLDQAAGQLARMKQVQSAAERAQARLREEQEACPTPAPLRPRPQIPTPQRRPLRRTIKCSRSSPWLWLRYEPRWTNNARRSPSS